MANTKIKTKNLKNMGKSAKIINQPIKLSETDLTHTLKLG